MNRVCRRHLSVSFRFSESIGHISAFSNVEKIMKSIDKGIAKGPMNLQSILQSVDSVYTFRCIVHSYNQKKEFKKTTLVFKNGSLECRNDFESLLAAMTAYTCLGTPAGAKSLLMAMENKNMSPEFQALSFEVMLIGYSRTDRLDFVEGALYEWLLRCGGTGSKLIETLGLTKKIKVSVDLQRILSINDTLPLPGLKTWASVAKLYAGRYASDNCLKILDIGKSISASSISSNANHIVDTDASLIKIYLYTIRALCDVGQFEQAVATIRELMQRDSGKAISSAYLLAHLLKYYRFRDGGLQVDKDQLDLILASLKKERELGVSYNTAGSDEFDGGYGSSQGLSSAFVSLLCLRGLPESAERIIRTEALAKKVRPSAVVMVINSFVKQGSWQKAEELFWEFYDAKILKDASARDAYHHVCQGMRDSRQLHCLMVFMTKFSQPSSEPSQSMTYEQ